MLSSILKSSSPVCKYFIHASCTSFILIIITDRSLSRCFFIGVEKTPNSNSLMFVPEEDIMEGGTTAEFKSHKEARVSPLATDLFNVKGVTNVFFTQNFITVNKDEDSSWSIMKPDIFTAITNFYLSEKPILTEDTTVSKENEDEIVSKIKEVIHLRVRETVQADGGEISFVVRTIKFEYLKDN